MSKKFFGQKIICQKTFDEESKSPKIFLVKNIWPNKILDDKILGSKNFLVKKIYGSKNFWVKEILGLEILGQKILGSKKILG